MTSSKAEEIKFFNKIFGWAKGNAVISGLILLAITTAIGFGWKNADPPLVKAQIQEIKKIVANHIDDEIEKDKQRDIDVAVLKNNAVNTKQTVNDIATEQKSQRDLLMQILINSKQIKENTNDKH